MHVTGSRDATTDDAAPGPVSSDPVRWATGRRRVEWFALLDAAGAGEWDHRDVVAHLERHHPEATGWWRQSIAVSYARHRAGAEVDVDAGEDGQDGRAADSGCGWPA